MENKPVVVTRGETAGKDINWEIGTDIYMLLYIKQMTHKDLLHSTGNFTQYPAMSSK